MIDPTRNGARSQIKPDLRTSLTQRQMLLLNQQVSMRAAGEDACLMIIFGQQGMIEVQTSEAQGRRILMFIFFIIINCCLIFSEMLTPVVGGQISAGQPEGGETQSIAGSVLVGAPCPAPREDGQVQRIFRPNDQTEDNVVRDCWWCSLGQLCSWENQVAVLSFGTVNK